MMNIMEDAAMLSRAHGRMYSGHNVPDRSLEPPEYKEEYDDSDDLYEEYKDQQLNGG